MKKLLLGLALILSFGATAARAADSCPFLALTNSVGSPPVVTGSSVAFWITGLAPSTAVYVDGTYAGDVYDTWGLPAGNWFSEHVTSGPWSPGPHSLRAGLDTCTVNFSVAPPGSSVAVMTQGTAWGQNGLVGNLAGSMSPTTTSNGKTYVSFSDLVSCVWGPCIQPSSTFTVSGFASNPGQGWLVSATAHGVTKLGSAASFTYSSGVASWTWNYQTFGFGTSGTTTVTIVHN